MKTKVILAFALGLTLVSCKGNDSGNSGGGELPPVLNQQACNEWAAQLGPLEAKDLDGFTKLVADLVHQQNTQVQSKSQLNSLAECLDRHFKIVCEPGSCRTERAQK